MATDHLPQPDAELLRLLDEYASDSYVGLDGGDQAPMWAAHAALLDYIATHYVRRNGLLAARGIGQWQPGMDMPEETIQRIVEGE